MFDCKDVPCSISFPCFSSCDSENHPPSPPPPPPPPPSPPPPLQSFSVHSHGLKEKIFSEKMMIILACLLGVAVLFSMIFYVMKLYYFKRSNASRRRNHSPVLIHTQSNFLDEEHGPEMIHPIWYINTVGLQQSLIVSITVCKYKRDEGLIEGTDCSVCLSEFEDNEDVRLLPKCSHAFHLPCIDTWLRSHKNCPLCRAPIINESSGLDPEVVEPSLSDSGASQETRVENVGDEAIGDVGVGEIDDERRNDENHEMGIGYFNGRSSKFRAESDLSENCKGMEEEVQPVRRSVSMNAASASVIYHDVAANGPAYEKDEGCSNSKSKSILKKNESLKIGGKQSNGSSSFRRMMKRSCSSSGKFLSSRRCKSQESILPL